MLARGRWVTSGAVRSRPRTLCARTLDERPPATTATPASSRVQVTPELIRHTAALAHLEVNDQEVELLVPRIREFLHFVDDMMEVDVSGVPEDEELQQGPATATAAAAATTRPGALTIDSLRSGERPVQYGNNEGILANFPARHGRYLSVPAVAESPTLDDTEHRPPLVPAS